MRTRTPFPPLRRALLAALAVVGACREGGRPSDEARAVVDRARESSLADVRVDLVGSPRAPSSYKLTDLPVLPGKPSCTPNAINVHGVVVGECCASNLPDAACDCAGFVWEAGSMRLLQPPAGRTGIAPLAINERGWIVGSSWTCDETRRAVLIEGGKAPRHLDELLAPGTGELWGAVGINDNAEVALWGVKDGKERSFILRNGQLTDLGDLGGGSARPRAIDPQGQIVGESQNTAGAQRTFLWDAGTMSELPLPSENPAKRAKAGYATRPLAINSAGVIVGYEFVPNLAGTPIEVAAVKWDATSARVLPAESDEELAANSISDGGIIVGGGTQVKDGYRHNVAVAWYGSELVHLDQRFKPTWPWQGGRAVAINAVGQIVGWVFGPDRSPTSRTVLLDPVYP